jgi:hypothetical protein
VNGDAVTLDTSDANVTAAVNHANLQLTAANSKFEAYVNSSTKLGIREKSAQGVQLTIGAADSGLFTRPPIPEPRRQWLGEDRRPAGRRHQLRHQPQRQGASNDNGKLNIRTCRPMPLPLRVPAPPLSTALAAPPRSAATPCART